MMGLKNRYNSLDELGKVARGKSRHRPRNAPFLYGGPYPFIQTADITNSEFHITQYTQTYSEEGLAQSKLWEPGTLCIVNAGVNTGDNAILNFKACFPDSVIAFVSDESKSNTRFIKYYLDSIKTQIRTITMGATQDNLSVSKLLTFKVPAFSVDSQKKIAAILSAYDELIENNQRRIAILETMAEEIYREWFVRMRFPGHDQVKMIKGVPEGWEVKKLPDIADILYGKPFNSKLFNDKGVGKPIIRIRNIPTSSTNDYTEEQANDKFIIKPGEFLVGMDGEFHMNHWVGEEAFLVQRSCRIRAKDPLLEGYLAKALYAPIKYYESILMGATVGHLGAKHLNSIDVLIPNIGIREDLKIFNKLLNQKLALSSVNNKLKQFRDLLLPRLISGKLDVESLNITFPPGMNHNLEKGN